MVSEGSLSLSLSLSPSLSISVYVGCGCVWCNLGKKRGMVGDRWECGWTHSGVVCQRLLHDGGYLEVALGGGHGGRLGSSE